MTINYTHRTPQGHKARILCTDYVHTSTKIDAPFCVVVAILDYEAPGDESILMLTADLKLHIGSGSPYLTEYNPWQDVAIDTPVWVRDADYQEWMPAHFAGIQREGELCAWVGGRTSHTGGPHIMLPWSRMTLTNPSASKEAK